MHVDCPKCPGSVFITKLGGGRFSTAYDIRFCANRDSEGDCPIMEKAAKAARDRLR